MRKHGSSASLKRLQVAQFSHTARGNGTPVAMLDRYAAGGIRHRPMVLNRQSRRAAEAIARAEGRRGGSEQGASHE